MSELPKGWVETHLPNVAEVIMGQSPSSLNCNDYGEGIPFFQGKTEFKSLYPQVRKYCTKPKKMAQKDDVLLSVRAPVGPTNFADRECAIGRGLAAIRGSFKSEKYVLYFFRNIEPWLSKQGTGTTFKAISGQFIKDLQIQVAPLAEQKRIVEKLDQVLAQVDTIKARLDGIPAILKRFRQSVLAAAVSGKLTEEWRTLCLFSNINSNSFELKYIIPENFPRYEIPDTWVKSSIGNFCDFQQGMQIAKSDRFQEAGENRLPILRIGNYATGFTENVDYVDITYNSLIASEDDLILTRTGETRGLVLTGFRGVFHNNTFRINYNDSLITRSYLYFALQELRTQNYILEVSGRSAQPDLTHKKFGPCPISVPPLEEQTEIVRLVDQYFAFADTIEKQVQKAQQRVDKLTQSILAKAFRGELVPQDPTDEPADELLKRIAAARAESEALAKAAKKVGKKTGKS